MVLEGDLADLTADGEGGVVVVVGEKAVIGDEFLVAFGAGELVRVGVGDVGIGEWVVGGEV